MEFKRQEANEAIWGRGGLITKDDFMNEVVTPMTENYRKEFSPKTLTFWYGALKNANLNDLRAAAGELMAGRRSMPNLAAMKKAVSAAKFKREAGPNGCVSGDFVRYVCEDGAAIRLWKGLEAAYGRALIGKAQWRNWMARCAARIA